MSHQPISPEPPEPKLHHDEQRDPDPITLLRSIRRSVWILVGATALLYIVAIAGVVVSISFTRKTNDALCTFRSDLQTRVRQTQDYLEIHPEGFPGVSVEQLRQSLHNQQRTIDSLDPLGCDPPDLTKSAVSGVIRIENPHVSPLL